MRNIQLKKGFTLIELMVVVSIMAILATAVIINIAGQRNNRNIIIAENELVNNIRTAQSYTLSSRVLPSGQSAQYYVLKFDFSEPSQYILQAIYNVSKPARSCRMWRHFIYLRASCFPAQTLLPLPALFPARLFQTLPGAV